MYQKFSFVNGGFYFVVSIFWSCEGGGVDIFHVVFDVSELNVLLLVVELDIEAVALFGGAALNLGG